MRRLGWILAVLSVLCMASARPPWRARRRPGMRVNRIARSRVRIADWPREPATPGRIDRARFAEALRELCRWVRPGRSARYAGWVLDDAAAFEVDPFLIGALMWREGRCRARAENGERGSGLGLTLIHREMYAERLRRGAHRYRVQVDGRWVERVQRLDRFPFAGPRLLQPEANLYFTAALLAAWRDQHETVDRSFAQQPHRHYVSHWIWGDRVRSDRQEDRILTDRRRLLEYYGERPSRTIEWGGVTFGCPLDGCPRVISSWIGSEREDGARHHRGVDVESLPGEPVRAVADGLVTFAGVDLPGAQTNRQVVGQEAFDAIPRASLAAGGRYVCVRHRREGHERSVRSCYMHLQEVRVRYGQRVTRGEQIGTVGRTGMRRSAAHLHLELHTERLEDPSEILYGLLLGRRESDPMPTSRR